VEGRSDSTDAARMIRQNCYPAFRHICGFACAIQQLI
jgi:hypothetical protein